MQQWIYHIKGLESVFDAREVENIGSQINGVEELVVDFSAESIVLCAESRDVLKKLEIRVTQLGFRVLSKGYVLKSRVMIDDLDNDEVRKTVQKKIGAHTFVQKMDVRPISKTVTLTHASEFSVTDFICSLNNKGIKARLSRQSLGKNVWQTLASILAFLSILLFLSGLVINLTLHNANFALLAYVLSISCAFPLLILKSGRQLLLEKKLNHTFLLVLVGGLCIYLEFWFEAAFLGVCRVFLLRSEVQLGELLRQSWSAFSDVGQRVAFVKTDDGRVAVESKQLTAGHEINIQEGEMIPVDGVVFMGRAVVSNENLVGNHNQYTLDVSDKAYAGMILLSGEIDVRVTVDVDNSVINVLRRQLISMQTKMSDEQCLLSKITKTILMVVFIISVIVIVSVMLLDLGLPYDWVEKAMALIFVSGIGLVVVATQYSYLFSLLVSAKGGVYFFRPEYWKKMSMINTVILDKEGVVTHNTPEVQEVISLSDYSIKNVLCIAASLSNACDDKRFSPVRERASQRGEDADIFKQVTQVDVIKNKSIRGIIEGKKYCIGSQGVFESAGLVTESVKQKLKLWQEEGANILLVADEEKIFGLITIIDPVRDEISSFVDCAHDMLGLKVVMLSQDNAGTSQVLASRYGFDDVVSEVTDDDAERAINNYSKDEKVLLITNRESLATFDQNKITVLANGLFNKVSSEVSNKEPKAFDNQEKHNVVISLGDRLIPVLKVIGMSREIQSRVKYILYLIALVKIMLLTGVIAGVLSFGIVIGFEFLLGFWVLASTYRPVFKSYTESSESVDSSYNSLDLKRNERKGASKDFAYNQFGKDNVDQSKGYIGRHITSGSMMKHH